MVSQEWTHLDASLRRLMRDRLGAEFGAFAEVCQDVGLLHGGFIELSNFMTNGPVKSEASFTCSLCASAVVSAANDFGGQAQLALAEKLALWALKLEPSHAAALMCLARIADASGNAGAAAKYRSQIQQIFDRIKRTPESQLSSYEKGVLESL
jgi:hypothetical protein